MSEISNKSFSFSFNLSNILHKVEGLEKRDVLTISLKNKHLISEV
jgi:hypothetical protein